MTSAIIEYARLLRLPGLGGLSMAPVFGALSVAATTPVDVVHLIIIFFIGSLSAIYGFVLNDIVDVNIHKLCKDLGNRPLVKGTVPVTHAKIICVSVFVLAFVIIFWFFYQPTVTFYLALASIIASAITGTLYNFYGKRFMGSDILVALSEAFLVLFGAFLILPALTPSIFTWIIAILTFNQLLYMNAIEGGLKDADHDYLMNVKNIALVTGVKVVGKHKLIIPKSFQILGFSIRLVSSALVFVPFVFFNEPIDGPNLILLGLLVLGVLVTSEQFLRMKTFDRNTVRKRIVRQTFLRYSIVPIMLIPLTGGIMALGLILFPLLWYIVFTPLVGGTLFKPEM